MSEKYPNAYTKWSEKELSKLKKLYSRVEPGGTGEYTIENLTEVFGRSPSSIRNKAYEEGFNKPNQWTEKEINLLKKHYSANRKKGNLDLDKLAKKFSRDKTNICRKAREIGLTERGRKSSEELKEKQSKIQEKISHPHLESYYFSKNNKKYHSKDWLEEQYLEKDLRIGEIAEKLDASHNTVSKYLKKYGIKEQREDPIGQRKQTFVCDHCGKKFEKWSSLVNGKKHYCSYQCAAADRVQNQDGSVYSDGKIGKRSDLENQFFRSSWEANYARYLNFMGIEWKYEPEEFEFEKIKRGTRFYTPDFYLPEKNQWIEVKGWFRDKDKIKLKRFKKYYPDEFSKLVLLIEKKYEGKQAKVAHKLEIKSIQSYREIKNKVSGLIDSWE